MRNGERPRAATSGRPGAVYALRITHYDYGVAGGRRICFRYRFRDPNFSFDFIWSIVRVESSVSQISARPPSPNTPFVLISGWITIDSNVPAGTCTRSRRSTLIVTGLRSGRK